MDIEQELHRLQAVEKQYHDLLNSRTSLRDQFAMAALSLGEGVWEGKGTDEFGEMARTCYRIADAFLAQGH